MQTLKKLSRANCSSLTKEVTCPAYFLIKPLSLILFVIMTDLLAIVVSVNVFLIALMCVFAFIAGYLLRSTFISKCRKRIADLEKEMLTDNARILELEKEKAELIRSRGER